MKKKSFLDTNQFGNGAPNIDTGNQSFKFSAGEKLSMRMVEGASLLPSGDLLFQTEKFRLGNGKRNPGDEKRSKFYVEEWSQ